MRTIRPTHPLTGRPIQPLGRRKDGRLIWPIMGGSGEGGDAGGDGGSGDAGTGDGTSDQGGDTSDAGSDQSDAGKQQSDDSPWNDPAKAQAEIERLRRENGSDRTKAKEQAAKDAETALIQKLGKTLGLVKDGDDAPTVEELTKQLGEQTTKTEQASATARDTAAELVVWRNATDLKVDAGALTDSRAFAAAIQNLDPSSATFEADVKKAAQEAVSKNPKLGAAPAAGSSSADHGGTGGGTTSSKPKSLADSVAANYGT